MSKTIEEIKDEYAHETSAHGWFDMTMRQGPIRNAQVDEVAERYAQSQTQELQEQNRELVGMLNRIKGLQPILEYQDDFGEALDKYAGEAQAIREMFDSIDILLTKYNHLKSNTNETDKI